MKYDYKNTLDTVDKKEYEVTLEYSELDTFIEISYKILAADVKIQGFRPGKAPRDLIESKLGAKLVTDALGRLLPTATYEIIEKEKDRPVEAPAYDLKEMDKEKGIKYSFSFVNYPTIKVGDIKKIKVEKKEAEITEDDIESVIKNVVRSSLSIEKIKELTKVKEESATSSQPTAKNKKAKESKEEQAHAHDEHDHNHDHSDHDHTHQHSHEEKPVEAVDFELNDALIQELKYEKEKTLEEVKKSVKAKLTEMKKQQVEDEYANKIVDEVVKISDVKVPKLFLTREVENTENQFSERLKELKLDVETYLQTQGSNLEQKRKEWEEQAKKRIAIDLLLINIADQNGGVAKDEEIENEISAIEDPKVRNQYESKNAREYIRTVMTRQKGLKKLLEMVEAK